MTGVIPRGAQVRRVTGSNDTPDSSQNTMTALRRLAFSRIRGQSLSTHRAIACSSRSMARRAGRCSR
jgi:hypothetical protein